MFGDEKYNVNNPFLKECENCITDIWSKLQNDTRKLENQCYPNTYVWIEKFKDDNY